MIKPMIIHSTQKWNYSSVTTYFCIVLRNNRFKLILLMFFGLSHGTVFAQPPVKSDVRKLIAAIDTFRSRQPQEKLYLQLDKPHYTTGDTIWFKAYALDATYFTESVRSGLFYLELATDSNRIVKRLMVPLRFGIGWGNITLDKDDFPEGSYILRAYTNWMRNWGDESMFTTHFSVMAPTTQSWLVGSKAKRLRQADKDNVHMSLQFNKLNKEAVGLREMQLTVMEGRKTLQRNKLETDANGALDIDFDLPANADARNITIIAEDLRKEGGNRKIRIPVEISRSENIDLQFMPEGGNLTGSIPARIGFKAIGEDGKGIEVEGKISNSKGQEVTRFRSAHKGMGAFELIPQLGESYMATLTLGGATKSYPLPSVLATGTSLKINNHAEGDSLEIIVSAAGIPNNTGSYYLIGQARGVVCFAKTIIFKEPTLTNNVLKSIFPSGIVRFTLMNAERQPLNERITYIDQKDNLNISIHTDKTKYGIRDSIALNLTVTDKEGKPIQGSFSLAVTDDGQAKADNSHTIATTLLLSSDLKGTVEDPGYYLQNNTQAELDNLMLTQGWVSYNWNRVFNIKEPEYKAEKEFTITGKATSLFKGISNTKVELISTKPFLMMDTLTDQSGHFIFKNLPLADTAIYTVQAKNKTGKSSFVDIEVDKWKPPVFTSISRRSMPWYINSDSLLLRIAGAAIDRQKELLRLKPETSLLGEVTITAQKMVKGSKNLNGPGNSDQVLNEEDMIKAGKMTVLELLNKQIKGFKLSTFEKKLAFTINSKKIYFIIDGKDLDLFYEHYQPMKDNPSDEGFNQRYLFIKDYLDTYTAEDVIGIEVLHSLKYNANYNSKFLSTDAQVKSGGLVDSYAYLEITTRSGHGFQKNTPGVYLYKPLSFALPKKFYRPKYVSKENRVFQDFRSTLHWAPNIITNAAGKATVSFYAADKHTTYTIKVEGSDMNGNIGTTLQKAYIKTSQ